ncbi:MAG: FAD-dependent oxidoreductase, partial [Bryobacterales bacterium]|nr:FAD-dependent oxidoreductase [Bryobacterales bacterium]
MPHTRATDRRRFPALTAFLFALLAALGGCAETKAPRTRGSQAEVFDVVVYGGTSAAVTASVQIQRMGNSVVVVSPERHLGGLSAGGLGWTDTGDKSVIGGLAREFYHRIWLHYEDPEAWRWQERSEYGNRGQGTPAADGAQRTMWIFEPHVAEQVFEDWVAEHAIDVRREERLDRANGVSFEDG